MPSLRKLEQQEVKTFERAGDGVRTEVAREYDSYLADFEPDDYGEALLAEHESKPSVRNRLLAAAERRGWTLDFIRTQGPLLCFKVVPEDDGEAIDVFGQGYAESEAEQEELAVGA